MTPYFTVLSELELTESVLMQDTVATGIVLKTLKDMGVLLAIDESVALKIDTATMGIIFSYFTPVC
jgi:hypothetical protein